MKFQQNSPSYSFNDRRLRAGLSLDWICFILGVLLLVLMSGCGAVPATSMKLNAVKGIQLSMGANVKNYNEFYQSIQAPANAGISVSASADPVQEARNRISLGRQISNLANWLEPQDFSIEVYDGIHEYRSSTCKEVLARSPKPMARVTTLSGDYRNTLYRATLLLRTSDLPASKQGEVQGLIQSEYQTYGAMPLAGLYSESSSVGEWKDPDAKTKIDSVMISREGAVFCMMAHHNGDSQLVAETWIGYQSKKEFGKTELASPAQFYFFRDSF